MFAARLVASRARHCRVRSQQRKVGLGMRERNGFELDDVGRPALVLGVADAALSSLCSAQPAMESFALRNIGCDRLMAGAA